MIITEPLVIGALGGLLTSALSSIVGNRADKAVTSSCKAIVERIKKCDKPINRDLQMAVQRSFVQALAGISRECLDEMEGKDHPEAIRWLQANLKEVESVEYIEVPIEKFNEIELLLTPEGELAKERIQVVVAKLFEAAPKDSSAPVCYRKKVRDRLFEEMCDYFASEIKSNPRVHDIFEAHLLAQIDIKLDGLEITVERIAASLHDIAKRGKELGKPALTLKEYMSMPYIRPLLKYKKLIGRRKELNDLHKFLDSNDKIMLMVGDGGVGKTKLAIEFAKQVNEEGCWDVYFVNPDLNVSRLPEAERILLILDDATRCKYRDELIGSVLSEDRDLKLLLIDRPIFKNSIESRLKEKNALREPIEIGRGDIVGFLKEYCNWIEENTAREIEKECLNSFDFAVVYAEYYKEKGVVGKAHEVLSWKTEIYINDIALETQLSVNNVTSEIQLISLITPISSEDIKYLSKLPFRNMELLNKILDFSVNYKTGILFFSGEECAIKPDPLAEYLRLEFLESGRLERIWRLLLPYMPYRISLNLAALLRYREAAAKTSKILNQIWSELNSNGGHTIEYFYALLLFTSELAHFPLFEVNKINTHLWVKSYQEISKTHPEKEVRKELAKGIVNATACYGIAHEFEKMEACLNELRELHCKHPEKEVRERLAKSLVNATAHYRSKYKLDKIEACLNELRELHDKYPEKEVRENLAGGLVNATTHYGSAHKFDKMGACLNELRELHDKYPEKEVREKLAMGLYNATTHYESAHEFHEMKALNELRKLHDKYPEKEVRENLAMGLYNATTRYGSAHKFDKMGACLNELQELHGKHPEKEVRKELAKGLVNATSDYGSTHKFDKMEPLLNELRELHGKHPEKEMGERFAEGLVNATTHYGSAHKFDKMGACLNELRELHDKYPEKEVREKLAMGLYNATTHYGSAHEFHEMKALNELRELHDKYPEKEVREKLAMGLYNATTHYGSAHEFDKMGACLNELQELHGKHPEKEVRKRLAMGLLNATRDYGSTHKFDKMESLLNELQELHSKHPEKEVREELAMGLYNVAIVFRNVGYEDLLSLYELRFDLPDDSERQGRIERIENILIEEMLKIIKTEYNKSEDELKGFVQKIKACLRDETDAVLLMDKVSEKVPLKIQKLILVEFYEPEK